MHVLIIPSWYPRDPLDANGSFFREQAIALVRRGHRVGVIAPQLRSLRKPLAAVSAARRVTAEADEGVTTYRAHGVNWSPRVEGGVRWLWLRRGWRAFEAYVATHGIPDILHAHSLLDGGVLARELSARTGIAYVVTEHSTIFARDMVSPRGMRLARDAMMDASRTLAVSSPFGQLLARVVGSGPRGWEVLPNLVNESFLSHPLKVQTSDQSASFTFINVALMEEKKRQMDLLNAFATMLASVPAARLVIVGDGPRRGELERSIDTLGIGGRVRLTGLLPRRQVLEAMSAADALVLSSRYETFGVAVVEALALGKPVITTACGGPESLVRPQDGLVVPVADVEALSSGMRGLRENAHLYDAEQIRASCRARFGEQAVSARLEEIYVTAR